MRLRILIVALHDEAALPDAAWNDRRTNLRARELGSGGRGRKSLRVRDWGLGGLRWQRKRLAGLEDPREEQERSSEPTGNAAIRTYC